MEELMRLEKKEQRASCGVELASRSDDLGPFFTAVISRQSKADLLRIVIIAPQ